MHLPKMNSLVISFHIENYNIIKTYNFLNQNMINITYTWLKNKIHIKKEITMKNNSFTQVIGFISHDRIIIQHLHHYNNQNKFI